MTKEEKIKLVYGEYWESVKDYVDENGWHNRKESGVNLLGKFSMEIRGIYNDISRPKSLQGIENNNGWIKIEEIGNPKSRKINEPEYDYYVIIDGIIRNDVKWNEIHEKWQKPSYGTYGVEEVYPTHYQKIIKPYLPLY